VLRYEGEVTFIIVVRLDDGITVLGYEREVTVMIED